MRNTIDISIAKAQDARSELAEARLRAIVIRDRVLTFYEHHVGSELLEEFQRLFRLGKVVSVKPLRVSSIHIPPYALCVRDRGGLDWSCRLTQKSQLCSRCQLRIEQRQSYRVSQRNTTRQRP